MRKTSNRCNINLHQIKLEDTRKLLKILKSEYPDVRIRLPKQKWPKSWSNVEDPVVRLERNLYGYPLAKILWERQFEKIPLKHGWEKIPNWECLFVHREKGLFLSVYVDDIKLAGKKQNLHPMWKVLNNEVDLGEPTSLLDHENLGCTQRQCEISKNTVDNYRTMFESQAVRESSIGTRLVKIPNWGCFCVNREKRLFLPVFWNDIKLVVKKKNSDPMWKILNKEVDLGEPTSFFGHVYWWFPCKSRRWNRLSMYYLALDFRR